MKFYAIGYDNDMATLYQRDYKDIDEYIGCKAYEFGTKSQKENWAVPNLEYVGKGNTNFDVNKLSGTLIVFSNRAISKLREILEQYGELLPCNSLNDNYQIFHCTNLIDALDLDKSKITYTNADVPYISDIEKAVLIGEKLKGVDIFSIPQRGGFYLFFSKNFKRKVEEANLKGFVWDIYPEIAVE